MMLSNQEGEIRMIGSSERSPAILLITLLCSDSFYNIQIHFQIITLIFKETSEKVLQTELQVTGPADRFRTFEGHLLESGSPLVHFCFAVKEVPSYSCPCMGCRTIVFLFYTAPIISFQQGDCTQQYLT